MPQSKKPGSSRAAKSGAEEKKQDGAFEERLRRLEELSASMKDGELPLEDAVKTFEEGVRLARGLEKDLSRIERKIEILINNPESGSEEDKPELGLFPELDGEG
jgi:exodeoxyribonuclease VII small subunit